MILLHEDLLIQRASTSEKGSTLKNLEGHINSYNVITWPFGAGKNGKSAEKIMYDRDIESLKIVSLQKRQAA